MGLIKSCCKRSIDDKLMVTKMDLSHCGCMEVPNVVFYAERYIETLILASNQITSLPPQLFHCQEMKHLNLNDNCLNNIPPAIGTFLHLVSLKLDKNNLQDLPEDLKMCKKLKRLSLSSNPWKQVPNVVTQLISIEELYMNDCELNYLPASVGRLCKLKILELRNNNLCSLPLSMRRLESLNRLDISDNDFNEFPPCVPKLKSLKELLIDNNEMEEIVDIKNLVHLEHLDASYNHIIKVSETIGCCIHLNMLNLSFNYIEQLPNSIGNITYMQTLQLEMNELTEIPKSIGKLSYLEELNLCNNKLHSLPSTIGLLRNLRNINISRNIIEEFPPEIGSCSKLGIINAAYNRLRVLPSETGYLNNLKVLDLVGNFLMYLPITIINLRGIRAIWLSANQNVPLIPFTEDLNIASGERFLTNIALPQLGEIPLSSSNLAEEKVGTSEKTSMWNKKISFAEDDDLLPGKLHRTPTPFPKELRAPNRKHQKTEEPKRNDNYVNVIDGKLADQDTPLFSSSFTNNSTNIPENCVTQIREANIRRNNKDVSFEVTSQNQNDGSVIYLESEYPNEAEAGESADGKNEISNSEHHRINTPVIKEDSPPLNPIIREGIDSFSETGIPKKGSSSPLSQSVREANINDDLKHTRNKFGLTYDQFDEKNSNVNFGNSFGQQFIYSNLLNEAASRGDTTDTTSRREKLSEMNPQRIREMYHNDIIYTSEKNSEFCTAESRSYSRGNSVNGNIENSPKHLHSNNPSREYSFVQPPFGNINKDICKTLHHESPVPGPPPSANEGNLTHFKSEDPGEPLPGPRNECLSPHMQQPLSKEDFISIAEQMKNRNIAPPCYEIAKMYSTKAAFFENSRVDQLKSN